jgi:hypothetical protein
MKEKNIETKPEKIKVKKTKEEKLAEEPKKKGSKLIPKPKLLKKEDSLVSLTQLEIEMKKENENMEQDTGSSILPNIVVRLRCQLSDLNNTSTENEQISNPYEYKAWIPSELKTYNTTEYQSGSLSMEPIHFIGMETNTMMMEETKNTQEEKVDENFAYLDAKWLHRANKMNMKDSTPILKQMIKEESFPVLLETKELGKKRDSDGEISEYLKVPVSKDIQNKLHQQKVLLYHGLVQNQKKSACFWCTCEYDTPVCAIPFYNVDGTLDSYGSFCRPECAVAYLYSEKLDDSVRADRDHLINFYYGKSYGYEKRIKPAPNPHYLLDKFYGNLTIQEYRKLLKSEHLLATLDKPMTRIFPELHEITDDFLIQIYGGDITLNRGYRVKRASEQIKGPSKMEILRDQFKQQKV